MTQTEILECTEIIFRDAGFERVFRTNLDVDTQNNKDIVVAISKLKTSERWSNILYSVCQVGGENSVGIFRFDVEIEGPQTTAHFLKLCEYTSLLAPYILLGSIYPLKGDDDVKVHLCYDMVFNLKSDNEIIRKQISLILSELSCCLLLLTKRLYEIACGNFEVLENKELFKQDLENLNYLVN
ncbi:MAG: hypothetical protein LBJ83_03055 [Oscillospiraceae bacterium]|jgi:hypothetical protein|nr:hypothetical protein [Oscillospiraceae bacterium]